MRAANTRPRVSLNPASHIHLVHQSPALSQHKLVPSFYSSPLLAVQRCSGGLRRTHPHAAAAAQAQAVVSRAHRQRQ